MRGLAHAALARTGRRRRDVLVTCGGGMGSLLGPADGLYHDLGVALAAQGIATMRVGYRKPNDLAALRARRGRGRRSRGPARRAPVRRRWATRSAARSRSRPARCSARTAAASSRSRRSRPAARSRRELGDTPLLLLHGTDDEILPAETSAVVQMLAGHGEVVLLPGRRPPAQRSGRRAPRTARRMDPRAPRRVSVGDRLGAGELGDDRRELVDVLVADDDVRQAPPLAPLVQLLDDLGLAADERGARLERLFGRRRRTRARAPSRSPCGRR